jgi:hypothetical protein
MELARSLHAELTSGEVAQARDTLGTIVYDRQMMVSGDKASRRARYAKARTDYFTLLWCFERINAGRDTIIADDHAGKNGVACKYLDEIIGWHVLTWIKDLPTVKRVLENELGDMDDKDSWKAFRELGDDFLTSEQRSEFQSVLVSLKLSS